MLFYKIGGAKEDRTPDLLNAIQALSQLSYNPKNKGNIKKLFVNVKYFLLFVFDIQNIYYNLNPQNYN